MDHFLPLTEFPQRKVKTAAGSLRSPFQSRTRMISNKGYRRSKEHPRPSTIVLLTGWVPMGTSFVPAMTESHPERRENQYWGRSTAGN